MSYQHFPDGWRQDNTSKRYQKEINGHSLEIEREIQQYYWSSITFYNWTDIDTSAGQMGFRSLKDAKKAAEHYASTGNYLNI